MCLSISLTNFLGRNIFHDPISLMGLKGAMDFSALSAVYIVLAQRWLPSFLQTRPEIRSLTDILLTSWLTHICSLCLKQEWTYIISDIIQFMFIHNCVYVCTHMYVGADVPPHVCGGQKVIIGAEPFLCILETKPRFSHLAASPLTLWAITPAQP